MKYVAVMLAILACAGCSSPIIAPQLTTPVECMWWVHDNILYRDDSATHGKPDYWQTPEETMALGTGDCDDLSILLLVMLSDIGYWGSLGIIDMGTAHHMVVVLYDTILDPTMPGAGWKTSDIEYSVGFAESVFLTNIFHGWVIYKHLTAP